MSEWELICWLADRGVLSITPDRVYFEPENVKPRHEGDSVEWIYVMRTTPAERLEALRDCKRRCGDIAQRLPQEKP